MLTGKARRFFLNIFLKKHKKTAKRKRIKNKVKGGIVYGGKND